MARNLIVAVAVDISQYVRGLAEAAGATRKLDTAVEELNVDTKRLTQTAVNAAVRRTERLHQEVRAYRELASAAKRGSREQIAATNLATQAERRLASSLAVVGHEARSASAHASRFGRDIDHAVRGAASGSGIFHGFGRSLAFASGGFIAFHGASEFLRDSINAAREAGVAQRSLAAQMKASGESFDANREHIEKVAVSYGRFGFQNDEVIQSLTVLERGTGNLNKAISLQGLTANLARAKNLDLSKAATVVAKVFGGQETALRRAVPGLPKYAHGMELIRLAQAKLAGQAAANTTAAERFAATLHDTKEIVGSALLPTLNRYLESLGRWLQRMNESGKTQEYVRQTAHFLQQALGALKDVVEVITTLFRGLTKITGSTKNSLELLLAVFLTFKAASIAGSIATTATSLGLIGTAAEGAAGEVTLLQRALGGLSLGPLTLAVAALGSAAYLSKQIYDDAKKTKTFEVPDSATTHVERKGRTYTRVVHTAGRGASAFRRQRITEAEAAEITGDAVYDREPAAAGGAAVEAAVKKRMGVVRSVVDATIKQETEKIKHATVEQRNNWFDNLVQRLLGGITQGSGDQVEAPLQLQLTRLAHVRELLKKRIAITDDITRLNKLGDELLGVIAQQASVHEQMRQAVTDALLFGTERAGLTKSTADDVAAWKRVYANAQERMKIEGKTLDLQRQALNAQTQIIALNEQARQDRIAARTASQYALLGLGPTGEDRAPGITALRRRVNRFQKAIEGTFLDTRKNRSLLANMRKVLNEGLDNVSSDVRSKMEQMLSNLQGILDAHRKKNEGIASRYSPASTSSVMRALGFNVSPLEARRLSVVLSQIGRRGTIPVNRSPAFGLAGAGGTAIHIEHFHSAAPDPRRMEDEITRRSTARSHQRRGVH